MFDAQSILVGEERGSVDLLMSCCGGGIVGLGSMCP